MTTMTLAFTASILLAVISAFQLVFSDVDAIISFILVFACLAQSFVFGYLHNEAEQLKLPTPKDNIGLVIPAIIVLSGIIIALLGPWQTLFAGLNPGRGFFSVITGVAITLGGSWLYAEVGETEELKK